MIGEYFIELDHVRMTDVFEDVDLSSHSFNISDVDYTDFLKNFDRNFLSC